MRLYLVQLQLMEVEEEEAMLLVRETPEQMEVMEAEEEAEALQGGQEAQGINSTEAQLMPEFVQVDVVQEEAEERAQLEAQVESMWEAQAESVWRILFQAHQHIMEEAEGETAIREQVLRLAVWAEAEREELDRVQPEQMVQ